MSAFAAPMMGAAPKASVLVVVEVEGQALKFKQDGPLFANNIEVAILAMDEGGKVQGRRQGHRRAQAASGDARRWC